jgi:lysophospholipase L1-like esterase
VTRSSSSPPGDTLATPAGEPGPAGRRDRWVWYRGAAIFWLNTCLVFGLLNLFAYLRLPQVRPVPTVSRVMMQTAYPDMSPEEIERLVAESETHIVYEPFIEFRERAFKGRYVTIDERGFRPHKDQGPWPPSAEYLNVFVFGGSTTFSVGIKDDDAVPAMIQERLATVPLPKPARVYNLGHSFYYSSQERALFERLLVQGIRPDVAIFIDGLNDFLFYDDRPAMTPWLSDVVTQSAWAAGDPYVEVFKALPLYRWVDGFIPRTQPYHPLPPRPKEPAYDDPAVADDVLDRYLANDRVIAAVAEAHGVQPIFVWQPVPTYRNTRPPGTPPQNYIRHEYSRYGYPKMAARTADGHLGKTFIWCADIGEQSTETLYVDLVHYSPLMSRMLADCIVSAASERGLLPAR